MLATAHNIAYRTEYFLDSLMHCPAPANMLVGQKGHMHLHKFDTFVGLSIEQPHNPHMKRVQNRD